MKTNWIVGSAVLGICLVGGCHGGGDTSSQTASSGTTAATDAPATQPAEAPIPAGSPFSKLKVGMSHDEVIATIGVPTTEGGYATGKAFIPFNFGGDTYRTIARYKGQGTIIFSQDSRYTSGTSVIEIHYDPTELGYAK